ncbi:hypothetical protein WR25_26658 [Diploscapter pachys]|uniref:PABS domain-containing protein n=1 Tax=Diploscapter pachys TaxID=2018661 RepID=A0A2A2KHT2_9BILA|nr:hypothetical protein WR25_26658 [Diploscapter pachys]
MLLQDAKEAEFSGAILKTPTDKTLNALDSSKWEIDHQWLASGPYEGTFGNAIFWALDIPDDKKDLAMNILMIGLGGGTFSSHIAWKYPKVNLTIVELSPLITKLAVDWFGIRDDERHRVIVNDGAEYLKEALHRGERFDAILLDATYSNRNNYITAPVKEFLDEDVIKNMGLLLGEDGILVSNVVFGELKEVDEAKGMQFV